MIRFIRQNARLLAVALAVVLFCGGVSAMFGLHDAIETGSWGLSFREEGEPPIGNADAASLRRYDAVYLGDTNDKVLYLTFDAGYENGCTAQILDVLKAHNAKAAFFVVGNYLETAPELVQRMADEGHLVGNHTWHHYDMSRIADEATFTDELTRVEEKYRELTGQAMKKYYRPPQGVYSEDNLRMAQALGYRTVFWSLAYVDWLQDDQPTAEEAFSKLLPRTHPGAIVLLHSTSATNAAILDDLLTRWEEAGYRFGSLEEIFAPDAPF